MGHPRGWTSRWIVFLLCVEGMHSFALRRFLPPSLHRETRSSLSDSMPDSVKSSLNLEKINEIGHCIEESCSEAADHDVYVKCAYDRCLLRKAKFDQTDLAFSMAINDFPSEESMLDKRFWRRGRAFGPELPPYGIPTFVEEIPEEVPDEDARRMSYLGVVPILPKRKRYDEIECRPCAGASESSLAFCFHTHGCNP